MAFRKESAPTHSNVRLVITTAKSFFDCFHGCHASRRSERPEKSRKVRQENYYLSFPHPLYQNGRSNQIFPFCFLFILVIYFLCDCGFVCVCVEEKFNSFVVLNKAAMLLNVEL